MELLQGARNQLLESIRMVVCLILIQGFVGRRKDIEHPYPLVPKPMSTHRHSLTQQYVLALTTTQAM